MAVIVLRPSATGLPPAPILTAVQAYNGAVTATWTPQGTDVAGFIITAKTTVTTPTTDTFGGSFTDQFGEPGANSVSTTTFDAPAGVTTAIVTGLTNGLQYEITVVTRASSGLLSAPSNVQVGTPRAALPSPPSGGQTPGGGTGSPAPTVPTSRSIQAFPAERVFHPGNWLLTQQEADARG